MRLDGDCTALIIHRGKVCESWWRDKKEGLFLTGERFCLWGRRGAKVMGRVGGYRGTKFLRIRK